ncbi:MAG: phosphomannomutase/phosphoglucomutase [Candidatus Liptonbacteria bacterium]|nr:phosphomannomutase/phosphoglucomutase [Candidatus Liptonbacteria bacterium]
MKINPYIFRNYDIRGIADVDLDPEKVEAIGKAYGTFLRRRKIRQTVVGYDCRLTGPQYHDALVRGMAATGIDIIDLGMVMTQMVYFGQYRFQTNGGVMITASHNPWNYNGFKLATGFSSNTQIEDVQEIRKMVEEETFFKPEKTGTVTALKDSAWDDFVEDYARDVLKRVDIKSKFKIVVDAGRGTTGLFNPKIFERAGCEVMGYNLEPDGHFPIGTPDPTATVVMERVSKAVLENKADFGVTFDGDGDRIGIVDEKGNVLWNDVLLAIYSKEILERFPNSKIIYNGLCSQLTAKVIEQNGGTPIMWRTGYPFIKAKIAETGAAFGGELSGHFFFADNAYGYDDATYATLRILEYLSDKNVSLNALCREFPHYISSPEIKIGCPDDKKVKVIKDLSVKFKRDFPNAKITDDKVIPDDDGTRADFPDGMIILRASQNGPYITTKFEARDQETYDERKRYVKAILQSYPEMIWEDELAVNLHSLD